MQALFHSFFFKKKYSFVSLSQCFLGNAHSFTKLKYFSPHFGIEENLLFPLFFSCENELIHVKFLYNVNKIPTFKVVSCEISEGIDFFSCETTVPNPTYLGHEIPKPALSLGRLGCCGTDHFGPEIVPLQYKFE
jgi:hypothetical protein